tara:strand:- start:146 stop:784 length:639 start_codon:yes stop_codon:yes gene_type:complete
VILLVQKLRQPFLVEELRKLLLDQHRIHIPLIEWFKFLVSSLPLALALLLTLTGRVAYAEFLFYPLDGSGKHTYSSPYDGRFTALNGERYDVSEFYISNRLELNVSGVALWTKSPQLSIRLPWYFDNGYKSTLYNSEPVLQVGVFFIIYKSQSSLEFGISNLLRVGGTISERPCVDHLSRDFHCGTGLPWVDRSIPTKNDQQKIMVTYRFAF